MDGGSRGERREKDEEEEEFGRVWSENDDVNKRGEMRQQVMRENNAFESRHCRNEKE